MSKWTVDALLKERKDFLADKKDEKKDDPKNDGETWRFKRPSVRHLLRKSRISLLSSHNSTGNKEAATGFRNFLQSNGGKERISLRNCRRCFRNVVMGDPELLLVFALSKCTVPPCKRSQTHRFPHRIRKVWSRCSKLGDRLSSGKNFRGQFRRGMVQMFLTDGS